jgi:hypothetical protein
VILVKIASLTEVSTSNTESDLCWTEMTNRRTKLYAKQNKQFQIPVINNRYELLAPKKEGYEYVNVHQEQQRIHGKVIVNMEKSKKNVSRIIIVGDSHARDVAKELQHNLGRGFEVLGTVKPGSNIKVVTNMMNSAISSLTKKDVCILWGGAHDVAKNETEGGLRRLKDFVADHNRTNLVVMKVPHRHDLQINSCVNNEVKVFNRKLKKHSKDFAHLRLI